MTALYVNLTTIPNNIDSSLRLGLSNDCIVRQSQYNTEQHRFQSQVRSIKYTTLYVNLTTIPKNIDSSLGLGLSNILYCTSFSLEYRRTQIPVSGQVYQIYCIVRQSHYNTEQHRFQSRVRSIKYTTLHQSHYNTEQHRFQSRVRSIKYTTLYVNFTTIPNNLDSSLGLGVSNDYIVRQSHYNTEQHRFQSRVRSIKYTTLYVNLTRIPNNIDSSLGLGLSNDCIECQSQYYQRKPTRRLEQRRLYPTMRHCGGVTEWALIISAFRVSGYSSFGASWNKYGTHLTDQGGPYYFIPRKTNKLSSN